MDEPINIGDERIRRERMKLEEENERWCSLIELNEVRLQDLQDECSHDRIGESYWLGWLQFTPCADCGFILDSKVCYHDQVPPRRSDEPAHWVCPECGSLVIRELIEPTWQEKFRLTWRDFQIWIGNICPW